MWFRFQVRSLKISPQKRSHLQTYEGARGAQFEKKSYGTASMRTDYLYHTS